MGDFDLDSSKGLGRGLDALIPGANDSNESGGNGIAEVAINLIDVNPHQPRTIFNEDELQELSSSIKKHGVLQPLVVTPLDDHYELIAGERRLRASKIAGLSKVPVVIREADEHQKLEIALIENVHRSDLNPIDEAISYRKLIEEFNYTQDQVADSVGKSRASISNKIRLLGLPTEMKKALRDGKITEGHGKALLAISDKRKQEEVFQKIITGDFNVRDAERTAKNKNSKASLNKNTTDDDIAVVHLASDLKNYLGAKVTIKNTQKGGKIEIEYYSQEELSRIYQKIKNID